MREALKNELRLAAGDVSWFAAFIGGAYLLGVTLMVGIILIAKIHEYGPMGTFLALLGIVVAVMARRNLNPHVRMRLAVCMGTPRWSFVAADALVTALETAIATLAAVVLCFLENLVYRAVTGGGEDILGAINIFDCQYILLFILGMVVFNLFLTAFMNRFGVKGFFFVWIPLCLLNPLLTPAIYAARQGERSLLALLGRAAIWVVEVCSPIPWQVITLGILALVTAVSLLLLRKCPATL